MNTYEEIVTAMEEAYLSASGIAVADASDIGVRFKVLAGELEKLYQSIESLDTQLFPHSSTNKYLDMHAELRGIKRKASTFATGAVTISRVQPALSDIEIPIGSMFATSTEPYLSFISTEKGTIPQGGASVTVSARCAKPGAAGNLAVGKIGVIITIIPQVSSVVNEVPLTGGMDDETDEELRRRVLYGYKNISNGTNVAYYHDIAQNIDGVRSVNVLPRHRGRGSVDVVYCCHRTEESNYIGEKIKGILAYEKEINVDVAVYPATEKRATLAVALTIPKDFDSNYVIEECRSCIRQFLARQEVGQPLLLAHLGQEILKLGGVTNYQIIEPNGDITPLASEVVVEHGINLTAI